MEIKIGVGLNNIVFGMSQEDVKNLWASFPLDMVARRQTQSKRRSVFLLPIAQLGERLNGIQAVSGFDPAYLREKNGVANYSLFRN